MVFSQENRVTFTFLYVLENGKSNLTTSLSGMIASIIENLQSSLPYYFFSFEMPFPIATDLPFRDS